MSRRIVREGQRRKAIQKGRHVENVARNARYYAINDHPNYREFGEPEYEDEDGRQYRVAHSDFVRTMSPMERASIAEHGWVKLYVRLPPGTDWYPENKARVHVTLEPYRDTSLVPRTVTIRRRFIMAPSHRTGHAFVSKADWTYASTTAPFL
jgi:hypothetical protein